MSSENQSEKKEEKSRLIFIFQTLIAVLAFALTLFILIWSTYPVDKIALSWAISNYTVTPIPPSSTIRPSSTSTSTLTPTNTPTYTSTPYSASAYDFDIDSDLAPPVPVPGSRVIVLNDDNSVTADPDFSNIQWKSSQEISEEIGREIVEPYHATFGSGSAVWTLDVPLPEGIYEFFVMDTLFSSAGLLDFSVKAGNTQLTPLIGDSTIFLKSSQGNPPQNTDLWRSLGIYEIRSQEIISVATQWDTRTDLTIVAIDRVLIVRLYDSNQQILNQLPEGHAIAIKDDYSAILDPDQYWLTRNDGTIWNNQFQILTNPPIDCTVLWTLEEPVPVSHYELFAWIPEVNGVIDVNYALYANGNIIQPDSGEEISLQQGKHNGGNWISIGTWTIPDIYGDSVLLSLKMTVPGNTIGDAVADVIAFIQIP